MTEHSHTRFVNGCYRCDLSRAEVASPTCPTACDDDCEADCHEWHQPRAKREHQPEDCPGGNR